MATFSRVRPEDFHQQYEEFGDGSQPLHIVQLESHEYTVRHPFAREANHIYLTLDDICEIGLTGEFVLREHAAWAVIAFARRIQLYILACSNGLTWRDIVERRRPIPQTIPPATLFQLQMAHPMLFNPTFFESNPLLNVSGSIEYVEHKFYYVQDQILLLIAWIEYANYRKAYLDDIGLFCLWVHEDLQDSTYRHTDITEIPVPVPGKLESLLIDRLRTLDNTPFVLYASHASIHSHTLLQSPTSADLAITMHPDLLRPLPIGYSASYMEGPMLLLPSSMAPAVRAIRAALIPDNSVIDLTGLDLLVVTSQR